jgi:hypothetical protein
VKFSIRSCICISVFSALALCLPIPASLWHKYLMYSPAVPNHFHTHIILSYVQMLSSGDWKPCHNSLDVDSSPIFAACYLQRWKQTQLRKQAFVPFVNYFECTVFNLYWINNNTIYTLLKTTNWVTAVGVLVISGVVSKLNSNMQRGEALSCCSAFGNNRTCWLKR